ncbi:MULTISPECIES: hypothetical protein [Sphingobacterium]|uniref:hypothetical protein n=1 Tax=Sphingobacterium TaxID=28453 RepID=UPI00257C3176|nr:MULTISPECIES: hypothetical protein [Sphingobacterium]
MKILLISENTNLSPSYFKMFEGVYIENKQDVIIRYDVESAKDFLTNTVIEHQKHIDFIIADYSARDFKSKVNELAEWLRHSQKTYSTRNFQFASLPFFVMNNSSLINQNYEQLFGFGREPLDEMKYYDGIIFKPDNFERIGIYNNSLSSGLDNWLDLLKSDLDHLDIDHTNKYKLDPRILNSRSFKLRVLSTSFQLNINRLDYIWANNDEKILASAGDEILKLMKLYERNPTLRNEKGIHDILKQNNHILKGEDYYKSIYEKQFYTKQGKKYVESDFINFIYEYSLKKNEIYEVKLPNERFITKTGVPRILKSSQKYFDQVGIKYNNYFSSTENYEEMSKRLQQEGISTFSHDFNLSLLMGREEDRKENLDLISKGLVYGNKRVNLITYDNLIDRHQYLHQRVTRFGIN